MLLVKTTTGPSTVAGTGVFATEPILQDTIIWRFDSAVDFAYTPAEAEALPEPTRSEIKSVYHSYVSKQTGRYILAGDDAKYMNHSVAPNVGTEYRGDSQEDTGFALRDIQAGEELTVDYYAFAQEGADFL